MNRMIVLALFAFFLIFVGCNSEQAAPNQQVEDVENKTPQQTEGIEDEKTPTQSEKNEDEKTTPPKTDDEGNQEPFEIESATFEDGQLTIHYPQLTNMQDKEVEQQINHQIKEDATLYLKQYHDSDSSLGMNYEIIRPDSDIFSILYTGDYNGGMYPTHLVFSTNIDWKKGEKIRFPDLFVVDEQLVESLKKATYIDRDHPTEPNKEKQDAVTDYISNIGNKELIEALNKSDHPNPEENLYGIFSYFTNDSVIISIQVPHALGDHAEFEINTDDLVRK